MVKQNMGVLFSRIIFACGGDRYADVVVFPTEQHQSITAFSFVM